MIFNKNNNGASEIYDALGLVDADVNFDKWRQYLALQTREVKKMISTEVYDTAEDHYLSADYDPLGTDPLDILVLKVQRAVAFFAFTKIIPTLDVNHGNSGRHKNIGQAEQTVTAAEAYKDENNILNLAFEAVDDILDRLCKTMPDYWIDSALHKSIAGLLVPDLDTFDRYFTIGSYRLFYTLIPINREQQQRQIMPRLSAKWYNVLTEALKKEYDDLDANEKILIDMLPLIRRAIVLLTMAKGLERLPVELIPDGVVQTRVVATAKEKPVADDKTRRAVIASLLGDAQKDLDIMDGIIDELEGNKDQSYITPPHAVDGVKGFLWN